MMVNQHRIKNQFSPSRRNLLKNVAVSGGVFTAVLAGSRDSAAQQPLSDELAIQRLAIQFVDATNRRDVELFRRLWIKDSAWILGAPVSQTVSGIENIERTWQNLLSQYDFMTQIVNNGIVEVDGNRAKARWYTQEFAHSPAGKEMMNYGLYLDDLERDNDSWLFLRRSYSVLYLEEFDAAGKGKVFPMPNVG